MNGKQGLSLLKSAKEAKPTSSRKTALGYIGIIIQPSE